MFFHGKRNPWNFIALYFLTPSVRATKPPANIKQTPPET